ncbi:hypothetical protein ECSTECDG1313_5607 [Escherichia coli STEC_DG131-3]|nr:hypothetical protein ECSTECDG1313_5607 [Escherichia coli STEC_DG131-3]EMX49497.1 hypothetical protein ECJURUA2010_3224 [Escherichia coli Jurua 20/10]CDL05764.1 hypothetical protein [Escherichia coli IS35]
MLLQEGLHNLIFHNLYTVLCQFGRNGKEKDMYTGLCFLPPQEITTTHIANHLYQDNNFLPEPEL